MITSWSRADPAASSISVASVPPTYVASAPASASRSRSTVAFASSLPGSARRGRRRSARAPSAGRAGPRGGHPGDGLDRLLDLVGVRAGHHDRRVGEAGRERLGQPLSGADRLRLVQELVGLAEPDLHLVSPSASPPSTSEQTTMAVPGRRSTTPPTRCHRVSVSTSVGWPTRGTSGQNTHRPQITSAQGSTTRAAVAATTMPTAQASPSAAGRREDRQQQGQQADDHGRRAGEHRLGSSPTARAAWRRTGPRGPSARRGTARSAAARSPSRRRRPAPTRCPPSTRPRAGRRGRGSGSRAPRPTRSATPTTARGTIQRIGLR